MFENANTESIEVCSEEICTISSKRFEELVAAETKLEILKQGYLHKDSIYHTDVMSLIFGEKSKEGENGA